MKMIIHITSFLETKLYTVCVSSNLHVINDDHIFSQIVQCTDKFEMSEGNKKVTDQYTLQKAADFM